MVMIGERAVRGAAMMVGVVAVLATQVGCTTALKQAYYEVTGAKADILFNRAPESSEIRAFQAVKFDRLTTELTAELLPPAVLRYYRQGLAEQQFELHEHFPGGDPTLRVDSEITYFQEKGILSPAMMISRVRLLGPDDRLLGDLLVRVESKSFREGDAEDVALAATEGLGKYLIECKDPEAERDD